MLLSRRVMLETCAWHRSPGDPTTLSQNTGALVSALSDLPCRAARPLSGCMCSLRRQPSVPGDSWLLDSVPKDCLVKMPWDVSSSFPQLISGVSPHIASCPLCSSLTTFSPPALLLSSSHDLSLSYFLTVCLHPIPHPGFSSTGIPRCWCSWGRGGIQLGSDDSKEVGHISWSRGECRVQCGHGVKLPQ